MKTLIVGGGQIGRALDEVLACYHPKITDTDWSKNKGNVRRKEAFDVMHVTIPYTPSFEESVRQYQNDHQPKVTVIHSTVSEGTSRKLGAVFSPVVGLHPFLVRGMRTFTKFLAGKDASLVADYFRRAGLKVYIMDNPDALEYAKLRQTKFYALQIEFVKDTARDCRRKGYSFSDAYTIPSQDYNRGYDAQGLGEYHLPLLTPILKPQGGHCTIPNLDLQPDAWSHIIRQFNAEN